MKNKIENLNPKIYNFGCKEVSFMSSAKSKIEKIFNENKGKIYSISDFYNLASKNTIKSILLRMCNEKRILRVIEGLYVKPEYSDFLEEDLLPSHDEVADKIAAKFNWRIAPSKLLALNFSGVSEQVCNEYIYITNGNNRVYTYQGRKIIFKHVANKFLGDFSDKMLILIQAIKGLGKNNISAGDIETLARYSKNIPEVLKKDYKNLPYWIQETLYKIGDAIIW